MPVHPIQALAARRRDDDNGFTLIELMVVVLIIAILIAIAIPTFLGARQRAQDRAAQSDLRNGLTAEETTYTDTQAYSDDTATMKAIEPSLDWNGATARALTVTVDATGNIVCLEEDSKSGTTFAVTKIATGGSAGVYYGKNVNCADPAVDTSAAAGWGSSW
jgi:type IV pilus assembly protein PilA